MPLTPRQTNKGIPLRTEAKGGGIRETVGEIPPEFRCALDLTLSEQPVPYDTPIPLLSDTILSTRVEQQFTSESTLRQVTKPPGVVTLQETYTDKYKQAGTRTRNFRPITDLPLIGLPSATRDVNTKNLGNYHFIEDIEDSGTLFTQQVFSVERPDSAPEHFKELLPLISESHVELGIATMPVLLGSEYKKSEGQQDVYTKKIDRTYRDPIAFPAHLSSYRLTPEQQVATGLDTLDDSPLNINESDAETVEARAEDLGDGTWYKTKFDVPVVFHKPTFARERQILGAIPAEFRVGIETVSTSSELAGIAADPGVLTGTIEQKSEEQTTAFKKKIAQRELDLDPTAIHTDFKMTPEQQLETLDIELTDVSPTPSAITALTVEEEIKTLGGGLWLVTEGTVPIVFDKHLYAKEQDLLGAIPPEFRSGIEKDTESYETAGVATWPTLTGTQEYSSEQQVTQYKMKVETRELDVGTLGTHTDYKMTPDQQLETLSRAVTNVEPSPSSFTALTVEAEIKTLGGGLWLQTDGTVDSVFDKQTYVKERQLFAGIPAEFRGLVTESTNSKEDDDPVVDPTLLTGESFKSEQRLTEFRRKIETKGIDLSGLPATLTEHTLTQEQQIETITRQLNTAAIPVVGAATTLEMSNKQIGSGLYLNTEGTVGTVFDKHMYSEERDLLGALPAEFRAGVDRVTESYEDDNPAVAPTLAPGQEFESQQRVTAFKRKVETKFLDFDAVGTLPGEELTELYGGGALTTSKEVSTGSLSVTGNYLTTEGKAQAIGGGLFFKEIKTRDVGPWPLLHGQQYDERLDTVLPFTEQVKDASTITIGVAKTDINPLDMWRSKARTVDTDAVATVLDAYSLKYFGKVNVEMPDQLVGVTVIPQQSQGEGENEENGTYTAAGSFSVNQSLRASAQASLNMAAEVQIAIKQFWGNNVPCTHLHFFLPQPVSPSAVITRINAILGSTVVDWPKFNPEIVNLTAIGKRGSIQVVATSGGSLSASTSGSSSTSSGGVGWSRELGLQMQTVRISPTIHGIVNLSGTTSDSDTISAHAKANSSLSILYELTKDQGIDFSVTPTSIPATIGAQTWPATGQKFLYRIDAQPYRYGYVQFHAIVVDSTDFPYN